jgi:hypothetical protein
MRFKDFGRVLLGLGVLGAVVSVVWWYSFYSDVAKFVGATGPLPTTCIYALAGPCKMVSSVAGFVGAAAYDPIIFWLSAILCIIGLISQTFSGDGPSNGFRRDRRNDNHRDPW